MIRELHHIPLADLKPSKLNAEGEPDTEAVPCVVMDTTDDAAAVEASLAENIARLPMDDMDQFEAFAALSKKGLEEKEITSRSRRRSSDGGSPSVTCIPTSVASTGRARLTRRLCIC